MTNQPADGERGDWVNMLVDEIADKAIKWIGGGSDAYWVFDRAIAEKLIRDADRSLSPSHTAETCDCCDKPCEPRIKADWGGYFCAKCYSHAVHNQGRIVEFREQLAAAAEQLREKDEELKRLGARLAAAERLLDRAWVAKQSFWYHEEVCIHHPFFSSGWVAQKNPLLIGRKGTTAAEALRECHPHQFNGWGFDNPVDAYLAAVAANWLPTERKDG